METKKRICMNFATKDSGEDAGFMVLPTYMSAGDLIVLLRALRSAADMASIDVWVSQSEDVQVEAI